MNEEILNKLDMLAAKLGVTATHLWEVLIKQVYVNAAFSSSLLLLVIISIIIIGKYMEKIKDFVSEHDLEPIALCAIMLLAVILITAAVATIVDVSYLFNPEFFALKEILGGANH